MLDGMSDTRKIYLAKIAETFDPYNNIYQESLQKERDFFASLKKKSDPEVF